MSRVIDLKQYDTLTALRNKVTAAISANSAEDTHRSIGMVQGYLIGLFTAGEIDAHDVQSLEAESFAHIDFLLNARRVGNVH